jgi:endonuclease/exonuclease/phosphatase family metal-dependent hydrolase
MDEITTDSTLKVATLNLHSGSTLHVERVTAAIIEAHISKVDVVLVQEVHETQRELLRLAFSRAGYSHTFISEPASARNNPNNGSSTAIFSRKEIHTARDLNLTNLPGAQKAAVSILQTNGYEIHLVSAHLAWGAEHGHLRLRQAMLIADYARRVKLNNPNALLVAGGTFNDTPDSDSVRYLEGKKSSDDSASTFWLDVTQNSEFENTPTTRYDTVLGKETAIKTGILRPEMLPARKVDYLFTHGWVYGKAGMPLRTTLFGTSTTPNGDPISDHYGIATEIWLPKQ